MNRYALGSLLACIPFTSALAQQASLPLIVVEDHGGVSALPYYQTLDPQQDGEQSALASPAPAARISNPADTEAAMLPVRSTRLSPGDEPRRVIHAPGLTPLFLVGDDARSRAWLRQRHDALRDVHAVGLVVNVGVGRINLRRDLKLDTLLPTLPVHARALPAWRLEDQWVTAVRLTNTATRWLDLDPRALQGDFVAATFQHPTLGPTGQPTDTTVVYLLTRGHGLAESLLPAIAPIDASVNLPPAAAAGESQGRAR